MEEMEITAAGLQQVECFNKPNIHRNVMNKGRLQKKKTSYLVTLSKKVGGGQDQITISGPLEIMTSL